MYNVRVYCWRKFLIMFLTFYFFRNPILMVPFLYLFRFCVQDLTLFFLLIDLCSSANRKVCGVRLLGVLPTAESDSAVSLPLQSQTSRCPAHCRVRLRGVLPTAESDSAVSCLPQSQTPRCPAYRRVCIHDMHHGVSFEFTEFSNSSKFKLNTKLA